MGTAARIGLPGALDSGRVVLDCWLGSGHEQQSWDVLSGFGVNTGKNIRGALLCFETQQSLITKGYGVDVCAPSTGTTIPEYWTMPAGIIAEDLILGRDRIQERWVKVLRLGPTDRILMGTGAAENNVNSLWSNPGNPGVCSTHQHVENRDLQKLRGFLEVSATPAIVDLSGAVGINSNWANNRRALSATIAAGGAGYSVGDLLTLVGGTFGQVAIARVTTVNAGAVTAVAFSAPGQQGYYSALPGNPVATASAPGAGCTLNVTWQTIDPSPWFDRTQFVGPNSPGGVPTLFDGKVFVAFCPIGNPLPATSPDLPSWASTFRPGYVQIGGISSR